MRYSEFLFNTPVHILFESKKQCEKWGVFLQLKIKTENGNVNQTSLWENSKAGQNSLDKF